MKKKIIFAAPKPFSISDKIAEGLSDFGFEVINISYDEKFKYKSFYQKMNNFFKKTIGGNRNSKILLKFKPHENSIKNRILESGGGKKIDYALFIRPDLYPKPFLKWVKEHTETIIAYQWDGFNKFPQIKGYENYFDRFFVFDEDDIVKGETLPLTNFYFEHDIMNVQVNEKEVYFLGIQGRERAKSIKKIIEHINRIGFKSNIMLFKRYPEQNEIQCEGIIYIDNMISYKENLKNVCSASTLIDFHGGTHKGLSFRAFESVGYGKKLITNNVGIKKYDFYNENNIFVWEKNNFSGLDAFLAKPYEPIDDKIRKKYSFNNWIKYILDIPPYQEIKLPD